MTLVGTALVLAAAFSSLLAFRFGAPLLLLFLAIGLLSGTDGLGIEFDNARVAYFVGSIALALILFDSGFGTPMHALKQAAAPALVLATVGVVITAGIMAVAAHFIMGLTWLDVTAARRHHRLDRCGSRFLPAACRQYRNPRAHPVNSGNRIRIERSDRHFLDDLTGANFGNGAVSRTCANGAERRHWLLEGNGYRRTDWRLAAAI